mgnify:CR=1 FL=1
MKIKKAIITGVTGQDGSYLVEFLLKKKYIVHGIKRKSSSFNTSRIDNIFNNKKYRKKFFLHYGDLTDTNSINALIKKISPDEIYNFAAQSHVGISFEMPEYTTNVNALGALRILESIKYLKLEKKTKFYQASTSELFGEIQEKKQSENTKFYPKSPYASSKLFSYWITKNYRESYGIFASNGILFNHESPRRGETFVTRKITRAAARVKEGLQEKLFLGNLNAKRDWGYAPEYCDGMWRILQQEKPEDILLATGEQHSVREFTELAFEEVGIEIKWVGENENEYGINNKTGQTIVEVDPNYYRPAEVETLLGNPSKAKEKLGWESKTPFKELVRIMVQSDWGKVKKRGY